MTVIHFGKSWLVISFITLGVSHYSVGDLSDFEPSVAHPTDERFMFQVITRDGFTNGQSLLACREIQLGYALQRI